MNGYLLCIRDDKFCIKYGKSLYETNAKKYIHLDEFKDKKHLIELIEKQIEQTIEEEQKKKSEKSNSQSHEYKHYSPYIDDKFYKNIFDEPQLNTDDSYGYNNSGKRKR